MAVAFLLGLGLGAAQPNVMSLVHSRSPQGRVGEALGLRSTIIHSSQVVLPLVFGAFGSVLGAAAMFWTMAALVCTGGVAAVRWGKHRRDLRSQIGSGHQSEALAWAPATSFDSTSLDPISAAQPGLRDRSGWPRTGAAPGCA